MSTVMSVTGPISAGELGITSIHEHIFLDLTRHARGPASLLNNQELAYDELMMFKNAGGGTIVDQTTGGLTESDHDILPVKHAVAVRDMAERTGINVILGAGWYREPFYEQRLYRARTDEIAEELVRDVTEGIDSTGVRAGVLGEIGAHFTRVSPAEERVFRAVARAHKETGVTILTHTPNAWSVGLDQLDILEDEGTDLRRVVIGHSQSYPHHEYHAEIARRGAFVAFDGLRKVREYEHQQHMSLIKQMVDGGLIDHVLLGSDVCFRPYYVAYGGRGYAYIASGLKEELRQVGVTEGQYLQMAVDNPRRALTGDN